MEKVIYHAFRVNDMGRSYYSVPTGILGTNTFLYTNTLRDLHGFRHKSSQIKLCSTQVRFCAYLCYVAVQSYAIIQYQFYFKKRFWIFTRTSSALQGLTKKFCKQVRRESMYERCRGVMARLAKELRVFIREVRWIAIKFWIINQFHFLLGEDALGVRHRQHRKKAASIHEQLHSNWFIVANVVIFW